jgi:catechol 2,3-dioxygenase-like lactoylglutathione lyase family enzyme
MKPRINIVTLGVRDLDRSIRFYRDGLGWPLSRASAGDFAIFKLAGTALALYPRAKLAKDARLGPSRGGFGGMTLAHSVAKSGDVDIALRQAAAAGARILKPARHAAWGGRSGYFADPDGHPWEVAWNPHFKLARAGHLKLP